MEYAIIIFGLLAIGCTCMLFMTITTYNRKISEVHKALASLHIKVLGLESDLNVEKKKSKTVGFKSRKVEPDVRKEVIYKVPKKITGDLTMTHHGKSALVQATLKVKKTE
ncbi:MAG: hypothetical protein CMB77_03755 [Euryarchaeota archaeon]|nr:hypothetical protein [Euryarchaeota archaeon]|tara:strand:- start:702 stop:1031 length:330 start_codon:yes stop_codon:yes gene_type:complete